MTACGPSVQVIKINELPKIKQTAVANLRVYDSSELTGVYYERIGIVRGHSCKYLPGPLIRITLSFVFFLWLFGFLLGLFSFLFTKKSTSRVHFKVVKW